MRRLMLMLTFTAMAIPASAQTSDGAFGNIASTSLAEIARGMHATIRRNLAEAAERMPAKTTPSSRRRRCAASAS